MAELEDLLENLRKSPLKPAQKVYTVIHHVCPRLQHRLVLGKISKEKLHRIDRKIRFYLRKLLNFPGDSPNSYFHAVSADGGMGIPSFKTRVPRLALSRLTSLSAINEPDVQAILKEPEFDERCTALRKMACADTLEKSGEREHWRAELSATLDGKGLQSTPSAGYAQNWVNDGSQVKGRRYIGALQTRGNLCHTPVRLSRGGGDEGWIHSVGSPRAQEVSIVLLILSNHVGRLMGLE